MHLDENTMIGDILDIGEGCEEIFLSMGMECMGCPAARGESIREACEIHEVDAGELLERLRRWIAEK